MICGGVPSFVVLRQEDGQIPTFWLLLYSRALEFKCFLHECLWAYAFGIGYLEPLAIQPSDSAWGGLGESPH